MDIEDVVVNTSLSDSDISNRKRVVLMEATKASETGKKNLGLVFGEMNKKL